MIDFDVITGPGPETVAPRQEPPRKPTAPASLPPVSSDGSDGTTPGSQRPGASSNLDEMKASPSPSSG